MSSIKIGTDTEGGWVVERSTCPACKRFVLELVQGQATYIQGGGFYGISDEYSRKLIRPRIANRTPCPPEVPPYIAEDYNEAGAVLAESPKASAALSRRCLQAVLRGAAGVEPGDPVREIQQALDARQLPSWLASDIDAIRNTGNFSAHPTKSTNTGDVVPVEPHEAEWNLQVLASLFDFYYVHPAVAAQRRATLNAKLADAGKPAMKEQPAQ